MNKINKLKLELKELLIDLDTQEGDLSDTNSELLFALENDPELDETGGE